MNRRGIAAYCLAAWICGSTFASMAIWVRTRGTVSPLLGASPAGAGFFFFCFLGLILGFVPSLLEGFLLWAVAHTFHLRGWWPWGIAGMLVVQCATMALAHFGGTAGTGSAGHDESLRGLQLVTLGPAILIGGGWWWLPAISGALTGVVLSRVQAAFSATPQT